MEPEAEFQGGILRKKKKKSPNVGDVQSGQNLSRTPVVRRVYVQINLHLLQFSSVFKRHKERNPSLRKRRNFKAALVGPFFLARANCVRQQLRRGKYLTHHTLRSVLCLLVSC